MNKEYRALLLIGLGIVSFMVAPFLILGTNSFLIIHDNLDGEFACYQILKIAGLMFGLDGSTPVNSVMNGLPRGVFHSEFSFLRLLFLAFPPFWAYVINTILIRSIGFAGMYFFCRDYLLKGGDRKIILILACLFAAIPLYSIYGLSVMGQPLLIWAFLNLCENHQKTINWIIIILFPFYSHFALIAPFMISALLVYGIFRLRSKEYEMHRSYFIGLGLLGLVFFVSNLTTILGFLFPGDYVSHREVWVEEQSTLKSAGYPFVMTFLNGQYHSSSFNCTPLYLLAALCLWLTRHDKRKMTFVGLPLMLIAGISLFQALYPFITYHLQHYLHLLVTFQFNRFTFLIPFLWFITLGTALKYALPKIHPAFLYALLVIQFLFILEKNEEFKTNSVRIFSENKKLPTYKSYFAYDLFSRVSEKIGLPKSQYRVVSLGIHPSVTQCNGFYTLDGYLNNYPLSYKQDFRKIISEELDNDPRLKEYFDDWGSKCFVFSSELKKKKLLVCSKYENAVLEKLRINTEALKNIGGDYLFSALKINNAKELNLALVETFTDENSWWNLYLYKVN